jgi:hypothetical protein
MKLNKIDLSGRLLIHSIFDSFTSSLHTAITRSSESLSAVPSISLCYNGGEKSGEVVEK